LAITWLLPVASALVALVALLGARRAAKRLERLSESYWELRYENGQLKGRVTRLEAAAGVREELEQPARPAAATTFVPLSSLRK
jgi:membrane protein implicated in regulation of membrane protease activity